ncbi:hypothetical protein LNV09_00005, partial [Paucibacter sp. B2R-40]|uniref:hypothetical protein n=1 Tax=Paucibacter sp. B2R-40 TaxID=2893554 RepID=UPI0021E47144
MLGTYVEPNAPELVAFVVVKPLHVFWFGTEPTQRMPNHAMNKLHLLVRRVSKGQGLEGVDQSFGRVILMRMGSRWFSHGYEVLLRHAAMMKVQVNFKSRTFFHLAKVPSQVRSRSLNAAAAANILHASRWAGQYGGFNWSVQHTNH